MSMRLLLVAVTAALTAGSVAAEVIVPYEKLGAINTPCANSQCIISFPAVPPGKRLVITAISAQLGPAASSFVMEGGTAPYFVPKNDPAIGTLSQPVTLYYEPGSTPRARVFVPVANSPNTSLIVTVVGHLDPAQ